MPPPPESHKTFPTLLNALFILAALIGIEILIAAAYIDVFGRFKDGDPIAIGVVVTFANGIVFACLMTYKRLSFATLFHSGESSSRAVLLLLTPPIVLLFGGASVLMDDLMALVLILLPMTQSQYDMFARLMSNGAATLIVLCLVAPFLEEMLFRGVFLRSFLRQYSAGQAIVFSSALFAIAHMNIYQALSAFVAGLMLGWVYACTQSLWPCIVGHSAANLAGFLLTAPPAPSAVSQVPGNFELAPMPIQVAAVMSVVIGGYLLWKLLGGTRGMQQVRDAA